MSLYYVDESQKIITIGSTKIDWELDKAEPKYKLRKCDCCGGPIRGLTCNYCGAEYERY